MTNDERSRGPLFHSLGRRRAKEEDSLGFLEIEMYVVGGCVMC